jgi:hypothetical protein
MGLTPWSEVFFFFFFFFFFWPLGPTVICYGHIMKVWVTITIFLVVYMDHPMSDSIELLIYDYMEQYLRHKSLILYYRSHKTPPTRAGRD